MCHRHPPPPLFIPLPSWHLTRTQGAVDERSTALWQLTRSALELCWCGFLPLYHSALLCSSEVTHKGPRVMFLISAVSRKSCQCIYQSNHHKPDVRVWFLSHFSLLDNLLISFQSSTRFILIKLLSAATSSAPGRHKGERCIHLLHPSVPREAHPRASPAGRRDPAHFIILIKLTRGRLGGTAAHLAFLSSSWQTQDWEGR